MREVGQLQITLTDPRFVVLVGVLLSSMNVFLPGVTTQLTNSEWSC